MKNGYTIAGISR